MSLNGNRVLASIESNTAAGNTLLTEIQNQQTGADDVIFRLDESALPVYRTFALTSTRLIVDNTQFWANEYGIPTSGSSLNITFPSVAATVGVASTSADDTVPTGPGSIAILLEGLDTDFLEISEVVNLTGQTKASSLLEYIAINNATVVAVGSTGWNVGTIYIGDDTQTFTAGVPQTSVYRTIGVDALDGKGINGSNISTYTIPAGFTACPVNFKEDTDATPTKPILIRGIVQPFFFGAYIGEITIGNLVFNGSQEFTFQGFANLPEKSRVIIRSRAKTATAVDLSILYWEWIMKRNGA